MDRPPAGAGAVTAAGQPADTLIPCPSGFRRLGDLVAGEELFGADGRTTAGASVTDIGTLPVLRMRFDDGAQAVVTHEQLWLARDRVATAKALYRSADIGTHPRMPDGGTRWTFQVPQLIEFPAAALPADPYIVGCQLRAGEPEPELERYLTGDRYSRDAMLYGLLGEEVSLSATASPLALAAAASLIRSLGGVVIWSRYYRAGYCMEPLWVDVPHLERRLVAVEDAGTAPCYSIAVTAADGMYVTGADFVLTRGAAAPLSS